MQRAGEGAAAQQLGRLRPLVEQLGERGCDAVEDLVVVRGAELRRDADIGLRSNAPFSTRTANPERAGQCAKSKSSRAARSLSASRKRASCSMRW